MNLTTLAMTILLGVSSSLQHSSPQEWAAKHVELGLKCVNFPVDYLAGEDVYMAYKQAADEAGLVIAEVGVWRNTLAADPDEREKWIEYAIGQLKMAEKIGAVCCVNVVGTPYGPRWDGGYRGSFGVHLDAVNMITSPQRYFFNDDFLRECFDKLGPWIVSCHLKDILLKQEYTFQLQECAPGAGTLDIPLFLKLAQEYNPGMPFIIEHLVTDEEYIESVRYVQGLIK